MSFESDMKKWIEKTKMKADVAVRSATISISEEIIDRTPVDTGRLKGNWIPSTDAPNIKQTENKTPLISDVKYTASKSYGKVYYLVNSLPYARRIEYEGWSAVKAPQGMVRISVQNFREALKKAIK